MGLPTGSQRAVTLSIRPDPQAKAHSASQCIKARGLDSRGRHRAFLSINVQHPNICEWIELQPRRVWIWLLFTLSLVKLSKSVYAFSQIKRSTMMSKVRSPNFPVIDLAAAIEAVGKIYSREKRGKFPQLSAATHLGYSTINGRSLGMFAALRAYGLIEGRGDDLIVTPDAIALIEAPAESPDRSAALWRAFCGPTMFNRIQEQYPDPPSEQTLRWWLIQQGFTADGAENAASIFLQSRKLVTLLPDVYNKETTKPGSGDKAKTAFGRPVDDVFRDFFSSPGGGKQNDSPLPNISGGQESIAMGVQERILQSGMLSKTASYRVIVSGHVGETEIDRLLKKIEMDKEILADQTPAMPQGYSDHDADGYNG